MDKKKVQMWTGIAIAVLTVLAGLFFPKGCSHFSSDGNTVVKVDTIKTDTVFTTVVKSDTVWRNNYVVMEVPYPVIDTFYVFITDSGSVDEVVENVNVYRGEAIDSTVAIDYSIHTTGKLVKAPEIEYNLLQPYLIRDTIIQNRNVGVTIREQVRTGGIYLGMNYGFNEQNGKKAIGPEFLVVGRKFGLAYSYEYDFINQMHTFGVKKRLYTITD